MNCEKIQNLILTDYLDQQLDGLQKKMIEDHLSHCSHCKKFSESAQRITIEPFHLAQKIDPPAAVWQSIRQSISAEQERTESVFALLWRRLVSTMHVPQPALVLSTIIMLVCIAGTATHITLATFHKGRVDTKGQIEYLSYLTQGTKDTSSIDNKEMGTSIEQYFL